MIRLDPPEIPDLDGKEEINTLIFNSAKINFFNFCSYPYYLDFIFDELSKKYNFSEEEFDNYLEELNFDQEHYMLGYPYLLQNDYMSSERKQEKWHLLLQVLTDKKLNMFWGDGGALYFWIKESDLKSRNFDNVVLDFQYF